MWSLKACWKLGFGLMIQIKIEYFCNRYPVMINVFNFLLVTDLVLNKPVLFGK